MLADTDAPLQALAAGIDQDLGTPIVLDWHDGLGGPGGGHGPGPRYAYSLDLHDGLGGPGGGHGPGPPYANSVMAPLHPPHHKLWHPFIVVK